MTTLQERVLGAATPQQWPLGKLHRVLRVRKGYKNLGMRENNLLSLSYGKIVRKDIDTAKGLLPESFETYQIVEPGNIIIRLTDLQNDWTSIRQGIVTENGIITSAYDALEVTRDNEPRFWAYTLLALDLAKYYYFLGGGVRQSVKFSDFPNDWIGVPSIVDQRLLADFLDRETSRVDRLVEKKTGQLRGLEEEHQAFVSRAVIRGIGDAVMRASEFQWEPEYPNHWRIVRLKFLCARIVDCLHETPEHSDDGEFPSIRTADVERGKLRLAQAKRVTEAEYLWRIQRLEPTEGDIVYTREGERFGLAALVPPGVRLCLGQRMMMFRANHRVIPPYLMWSLNGQFAYHWLKQSTAGATSPHLNIADIRNVPVFIPPMAEQRSIVAAIEDMFARKDEAIRAITSSIDRLREFRAALITAAVTGQIDAAAWNKRGRSDRQLDAIQDKLLP